MVREDIEKGADDLLFTIIRTPGVKDSFEPWWIAGALSAMSDSIGFPCTSTWKEVRPDNSCEVVSILYYNGVDLVVGV
jgi:hypothetical protein